MSALLQSCVNSFAECILISKLNCSYSLIKESVNSFLTKFAAALAVLSVCPSNILPLRWAFFRRQNWPMVLVASSNHSRSASSAINSIALKNFTAFVFGRPSGRSLPALTSRATSSGVQFSSFATWAASNRAGKSFAAQVVIAACVMSSVINSSVIFGHTDATSYPVRPAMPGPIKISSAAIIRSFIRCLIPPIGRSCVLPRRCLIV